MPKHEEQGPQRLDKILGHMGLGSRSEIKRMAREGMIRVDGKPVKDASLKLNPCDSVIEVNGERIVYREFIYLMMNKPQGVVSATEDNRDRTVIDLLPPGLRHFKPFPVGRLDKDTEGLLLLTNDGKLAHNLLAPKKHVSKRYYVEVEGAVGEKEIEAFSQGVKLDDGYVTLPAQLEVLTGGAAMNQGNKNDDAHTGSKDGPAAPSNREPAGRDRSHVELVITEGKFHQVKRMFEAVGMRVTFLKRLSMGGLQLDGGLMPGEWRELSDEELAVLG